MKSFGIFVLLAFSIPCVLMAYKDFGIVGKTYPIKEEDALEAIQGEYKKINKKKLVLDILKSVENTLHADLNIPFCSENKTKTYDLVKPLENDLIIPEGDIFIPKGTIDESLKYQTASYVVVNMLDSIDFDFYNSNKHSLLIANGDIRDKRITSVVEKYILSEDIAKIFHITCTPSILNFENGILTIQEFYISREVKE